MYFYSPSCNTSLPSVQLLHFNTSGDLLPFKGNIGHFFCESWRSPTKFRFMTSLVGSQGRVLFTNRLIGLASSSNSSTFCPRCIRQFLSCIYYSLREPLKKLYVSSSCLLDLKHCGTIAVCYCLSWSKLPAALRWLIKKKEKKTQRLIGRLCGCFTQSSPSAPREWKKLLLTGCSRLIIQSTGLAVRTNLADTFI